MKRFLTLPVMVAVLLLIPAGDGPALAGDTATCNGSPATFVGTPGDDQYVGENFPTGSVILLGAGSDRLIRPESKNLTVCGGLGRDSINMAGEDVGRKSYLDGGRGRDFVGDGGDHLFRTPSPLHLHGGPGNDVVSGGMRRDWAYGGADDDEVFGSIGSDRLFGDKGDDEIDGDPQGYSYVDRASGGMGKDSCEAEVKVSCEL